MYYYLRMRTAKVNPQFRILPPFLPYDSVLRNTQQNNSCLISRRALLFATLKSAAIPQLPKFAAEQTI
jgi:hypothetical protein